MRDENNQPLCLTENLIVDGFAFTAVLTVAYSDMARAADEMSVASW